MKTEKTITITLSELDLQVIHMSLVDSEHDISDRMEKWHAKEGVPKESLARLDISAERIKTRLAKVKNIIDNAARIIRHG